MKNRELLLSLTFAAVAAAAPVAHSAPFVVSRATAGTADNYSYQAGVTVSDTKTEVQAIHIEPFYGGGTIELGSVTSFAQATTEYGLNRIGGTAGYAQNYDGALYYKLPPHRVDPGAGSGIYVGLFSIWQDTWTVVGGTAGSLVTVTVSGEVDYALSGTSDFLSVVPNFNPFTAVQSFYGPALSYVVADKATFIANRFTGKIDWSQTFDVLVGSSFDVRSSLLADMSPSALATGDVRNSAISFDAMNTSMLTRIDLPTGYTLQSASGEIVANDGGFAYAAVLAHNAAPGTVPEPETLALLGLGLAGVATARRRKS